MSPAATEITPSNPGTCTGARRLWVVPSPSWPDQLHQHAEIALAKADYATAEDLAMKSWQQGARQGSMCERNWQVVIEVRKHANDQKGVEAARKRQAECRLPATQP